MTEESSFPIRISLVMRILRLCVRMTWISDFLTNLTEQQTKIYHKKILKEHHTP